MGWFKKVENDAKEELKDNLLKFKETSEGATILCSNHEVDKLKNVAEKNNATVKVEPSDHGSRVTIIQ